MIATVLCPLGTDSSYLIMRLLIPLALWGCSLLFAASLSAAVLVGQGPFFTYQYSPRLALGLDTNAVYEALQYVHEGPSQANCSYLCPRGTTNSSRGTVTYSFVPDPGFLMRHASIFQKSTLYTSGQIKGEYSIDGGDTFQRFHFTRNYTGSPFSHLRTRHLRNLYITNLTVRYTLDLQSGNNYNVQFLRDCDDATTALQVDGEIIGQAEAAQVRVLTTVGSRWNYLDNGSDPGPAWKLLGFDDVGWASGAAELGYGDDDEATLVGFGPNPGGKHVTTYFRHSFQVGNPRLFRELHLEVLRDDGAVVHLNGQEVFRSNLPQGTLTPQTYASIALGEPDELTFVETVLNPALLVEGTNVLAVELHQATPGSSDISFDLNLWGRVAAPRLSIHLLGECVVLSWTEPGFTLEAADEVDGEWFELQGDPTSPYSICGELLRGFYRLKEKP